jgi:protein gp37
MTGVSYLDAVTNDLVGCTHGCGECWAREVCRRQALNPKLNLTPEQRERMLKFLPTFLPQRLAALKKIPKGSVVGVCFTGDLFDPMVARLDRVMVLDEIAKNNRNAYIFLTKRPGTMALWFREDGNYDPQPNWFLGVSCRDQNELDAAAPHLRRLAAAGWKTWLSLEPLRGPVDAEGLLIPGYALSGVILGGPSGPKAWPIHPDDVRQVRDQCAEANVPFVYKQHSSKGWTTGETPTWSFHEGHPDSLPCIDGLTHWNLPWTLRKRGA